jgi:hypothetical protein
MISLTFDWLIDYLLLYVRLMNFSLIWIRHRYRWRAAKFRPMLSTQDLWAGRGLYLVTLAVTRGLGFPVSSLTTHKGMWRIYPNPDPPGAKTVWKIRKGILIGDLLIWYEDLLLPGSQCCLSPYTVYIDNRLAACFLKNTAVSYWRGLYLNC